MTGQTFLLGPLKLTWNKARISNKLGLWGFPGSSDSKESACNAGKPGSIPGSGRSLREGNGYPLQYSCLENSTDRGAWRVQSMGQQSWTQTEATNTFLSLLSNKLKETVYHTLN